MRYFIKQIGEKDCALTCLKMLLAIVYKSKKFLLYPQNDIEKTYSLEEIIDIASKEGVKLYAFRFKNKEDLLKQACLPVLVPIKSGNTLHMVLIRKIKKDKLLIFDPADEPKWIDFYEFTKNWNGECLEAADIKGSLFKQKKYSFISWPYKICVPLFQLLSFAFLISALFFIDKNYSFLIPLCFLIAFVIFEFIYRTLLINEMKSFDNKVLTNINIRERSTLKSRFVEMNNFKVLLIGGPIQIINSVIIIIFGAVILFLNSYLNLINLIVISIISVALTLFEKRFYKNTKADISNYENKIFTLKEDEKGDLKEKIAELHKKTYSFINFMNLKKMILIFLIIVISLIYCAFTDNISLNFVLFHTFIYYYLAQNVTKLLESIESFKEKPYYLSLYQYYSN